MIPSQLIEDIRNKADIVKVVSEYVPLKKRGKNYLGSCPFHSEKDPSFTVSPEKQIFHCFGCGEGGNAFAFLMKIENISFTEAVSELGSKVGVAVPKTANRGPTKSDKDKYFQIMTLAAQHFADNLKSPAAKGVQEYLRQRNISDTTIKQFGLGFALPGWDNLFKHLVAKGAAPENIVKSGLILRRENSSGYYDRFRNRLIFPIANHRGQVVAFGGRTLGEDNPKYLNSPDTPIYHKGETLFGLHLTKNEIKKNRTAVLVEGNFDLITPFQGGINNIVASMGTALTIYQCKLLARHCDTIVLAFDADVAGGLAAERSVELMRNQGLKVKVANLTGGKDPDEIIIKHGIEAFKKILDSSLPFLEFKIKRIFSRYNLNEIEARAKALKEVAAALSQSKDQFVQNEYAKLAAAGLKTTPENIMAEV
ncbi:MAG: DNA primase, partial [Candidatus Margulisbacteria bacterium]|nr:DNA primase [Candidatus Margulisiibacteriota bacterium]